MKQVVSSSKGIDVIDVPSSLIEEGTILVEVDYSFISTGTELATLRALGLGQSESNERGFSQSISESKELIQKTINYLHERGIRKTVERVFARISHDGVTSDRFVTLGYSCSGKVISVGEGVSEFSPGDLVACAGANRATHSELVVVPKNLVVSIPKGCSLKDASSVAVGSIAMQGVRQSNARMGEFVGVIGLGLVGLLTVRLLKIAGCRVFGLDIDDKRVSQAIEIGADFASSNPESFSNYLSNETKFMGLDYCIITASSDSDEIVKTAMESTRKKGRITVLGFVPMNIDKYPFMRKEIEFVSSSSYGPGRYDQRYEEKGLDYPYAFVRWTEKRNMAEYLRLLATGGFDLSMIASEEVSISLVNDAYDQLIKGNTKSRGIFINYVSDRTLEDKSQTVIQLASNPITGKVRLAVVGAGSFVREVHLPHLEKLKNEIEISAVVNKKGANSIELARHYGIDHASTSLDDILDSLDFDAALIGTRHDKHAEMALRCLKAGKHVLVEKPLAITWNQLNNIKEFYDGNSEQDFPLLMTGFNRRFSPYLENIKKHISNRSTPLVMNYQINTKYLEKDHWQRGDEGGGRNLGEACHIYDLFTFLCNAEVDNVSVSSISSANESFDRNENFSATISFKDGSIGNLTYTSLGSTKYPKEICHIFCDQSVYNLNNYTSLEVLGIVDDILTTESPQKGHFEEMELFIRAIKGEIDWPIPLWQQIQATEIALRVEDQIYGVL
jgi:predicted dehydrogenase/threonine dehydrogenase-like Zn-dependent dehydrogenase